MIAIIAALPREIAGLVRGTEPDVALLRRGIHLHRGKDAVIVAGGMGASRAALAVEAALSVGGITDLLSIGLAGGCAPGMIVGSVMDAQEIVDARTGERFTSSSVAPGQSASVTLATSDRIASVREKARLHKTYGAAIVDMEAATVARLAAAHGLRFRAIKAVSDAYDFELASLNRFAGKQGSFRVSAFALHTALRPHHWADAIKLGRGSSQALNALEQAIRQTLWNHKIEL
jgi:adenosylhomocysteine nucleosidase